MSSEAPEKAMNENEPEARKSSTSARSSHSRSRRRRSRSRSRSRRRRRSRSRSRSRRGRDRDRERPHGRDRDRRIHRRRSRSREGRSRSREKPKRSKTPPRNSVVPQPNLALIQQLLAQQQANANPQLTRQARRLYVGNLPIGIGLTEPVLMQFFTNAAISVGITTPVPVSSIWVSSEGTFCFAEFRAVSDCTRCLTLFDGLQIGGRPLRIGRPADYAPAPPHLEKYVLQTPGLPPAPAHCTGVQPASIGVATSIGSASAIASVSEPVPAVTATEVMMLVNMTTREELLDDEEFADIELDIQEECENFGKVLKVVIPRPNKDDSSKDPEGLGRIWVRFENADDCSKARQTLGGRMFNNRKLYTSLCRCPAGAHPALLSEASDASLKP